MEKIVDLTKKVYKHQFTRYAFVGGTTFALDIGIFSLLHIVFAWEPLFANAVSYWSAVGFNFLANRLWTFKAHNVAIARNATLYLGLLLFNFVFSSGILLLARQWGIDAPVAKVIATGLQVIWTYFAYNRVVFKTQAPDL